MMNYSGLKSSSSTSDKTFLDKVVRRVLENFEPNLIFNQFGEAPISEVGADNIVWAKFPALTYSPAQAELIDGVTPNDVSFTAETISVQSKQYGMYVILTDKVKLKQLFNLSMIVSEILGDNMARICDNVIQNEATDNAINRVLAATTAGGTRAANRAAIGATNIMFTYDIACVATKLAAANAPKFAAGAYGGILHPFVSHRIKTESGAGGWLQIKQYTTAGQDDIYKGEIGMIHGVRIMESANVKSYASTVTVYPSTFFGKRAYGVSELQSMETIIHGFGSAGTSDALNQRMTIGVKKSFAPKILNQASIVVFECAGAVV